MLDRFNICAVCAEFIALRNGVWRDIEEHSFMLTSNGEGFTYHRHSPSNEETYRDTKYQNLFTETLSLMADYGYEDDFLGDADSFGFYEFFPDFLAITEYDSQGFVYSHVYENLEAVQAAWKAIEGDYGKFMDEEEAETEREREYAFSGLSDYAEDIFYDADPYDY